MSDDPLLSLATERIKFIMTRRYPGQVHSETFRLTVSHGQMSPIVIIDARPWFNACYSLLS